MSQPYPSDLTRHQFDEFLAPLIPQAKLGGRPRTVDMFAVINAILFVLYTGCQWRSLPHDYPNWSTVYTYFNQWRKNGIWEAIHDHLRMQVRVNEGRHPSPSARICDAQSVKTGNPRIETSGFDGGKLVKGRKRHILVDTLGLLLVVMVTAANVSDPRGVKVLFWKAKRKGKSLGRLIRIWSDGGQGMMMKLMDRFRLLLEVVKRSDDISGFVVVPKRWIVERTFAWFNWNRRLNKDYEVLTSTAEVFCDIAMIRIMVHRLDQHC